MASERTNEIVHRLTSVVELMETTHREGCPYSDSQTPYGMDQCDCFVLVNRQALIDEFEKVGKLPMKGHDVMVVCPDCGGSGENPEAKQAWDIPEAPTPECPACDGRGVIAEGGGDE